MVRQVGEFVCGETKGLRFFHRSPRQWRSLFIVACATGLAIPALDGAMARSRYWEDNGRYWNNAPPMAERFDPRQRTDRKKHSRRQPGDKKQKPVIEAFAAPNGPLFLVVSLERQHVSLYSNDGLYARSPISSGMVGHLTPMGIFNILGKEQMHHSNIYSGAPMPFMQRITWSGIALHEGVLPGYPASHGCIRLPHDFAKRMFGLTKGNERVIIARHEVEPQPFSHPKLPEPALLPEPQADSMTPISAHLLQKASDTVTEQVAIKAEEPKEQSEKQSQRLLNPVEYAKAMTVLAVRKAEDASLAVNPARATLQAKTKDMQIASVGLKKAQIALNLAKDRLAAADRQLQKVSGYGQAEMAAGAVKIAAEAKVRDVETTVETIREVKDQKEGDWGTALKTFKELDNAQRIAAESVKIWSRRMAPVSVFISRQTQRLYVRQSFLKVFDVPVTILDPEKPIGTHLYMAMPPLKTTTAASQLRWLVLTLQETKTDIDRSKKLSTRLGGDKEGPRSSARTASAAAALDRIQIEPEVARKISEMLWTGGSLIVSDNAISRETDDYSDFIILTR